jgi:hypothetical protein
LYTEASGTQLAVISPQTFGGPISKLPILINISKVVWHRAWDYYI